MGVVPVHAAPLTQIPAVHVCGVLPEHCFAPGAQTPVHVPLTHAWFVHAVAPCHTPLASHVWGVLPEHCVALGAQTPVHAPLAHT